MSTRVTFLIEVEPALEAPGRIGPRDISRGAAVALLLVIVAVFLAQGSARLTAPFGESHDGRNGATWASGSRSLREHGVLDSVLGAWAPERGTYAHHPPGIYVETWAAEAVGGV